MSALPVFESLLALHCRLSALFSKVRIAGVLAPCACRGEPLFRFRTARASARRINWAFSLPQARVVANKGAQWVAPVPVRNRKSGANLKSAPLDGFSEGKTWDLNL
jgi:hypothetical protein